MKKLLLLAVAIILMLSGCNKAELLNGQDIYSYDVLGAISVPEKKTVAVYISYLDLSDKLTGKSEEEYTENISQMQTNMQSLGINTAYFHVRPFCDSLYPSKLFPKSYYVSGDYSKEFTFDPLEIFIASAAQKGIDVYAWINPYRLSGGGISNAEAVSSFSEKGLVLKNGEAAYLDPNSSEVQALIADGAKEVCSNYNVKGIIFDDYFYPSDMASDLEKYNEYRLAGGTLTQRDYRIAAVSSLLKAVHKAASECGKEFGISPAGSIERNADSYGLDVNEVCLSEGYIDFISPQIYFGFNNQSMPFEKVLDQWQRAAEAGNKRLIISLAAYKAGSFDTYAGSGSDEWQKSFDILAKQSEAAFDICEGIALFRYDSIFEPAEAVSSFAVIERSNLKNTLDGVA